MSMTIGGVGPTGDPPGISAAAAVSVALLSQIGTSQAANVEALFGSLGLGANVDATA